MLSFEAMTDVPKQLSFVSQQPMVTPDAGGVATSPSRNDWHNMTRTVAHYQRLEQIGEGTYGQVYRATCLDTGRMVALKKMRLMPGRTGSSGMPQQLIREIKILKQLRHPNLLQLIEVVTSKGVEHIDPDDPITTGDPKTRQREENEDQAAVARERYKGNLFLVLEYVTHDLMGLMDVTYEFSQVQIKSIFQQLLKALSYMHEHKYVHRDIKSSNILLDSNFRLKLADFGLARSLEPPLLAHIDNSNPLPDLTNKVITLWYRSPEILLGTVHYGCAVDIWSAGCILAELLTIKPLASGKTELEQLQLIADLTGTPDEATWEYLMSLKKSKTLSGSIPVAAKKWRLGDRKPSNLRQKYSKKNVPEPAMNLLEKLLEWDPRKRLTAPSALRNRYFWTEPVAPENPAELGAIELTNHFHEFQTKQRRRQAKQQAEQAREDAMLKGASTAEALTVFDETYRNIMKQVAQEGFGKPTAEAEPESNKKDDASWKSRDDVSRKSLDDDLEDKEERKRQKDEKRSRRSSENRHDEDRSHKNRHRDRDYDADEDRRRKKKRDREDDESRSSRDKRRHGDEEERRIRREEQDRDRLEVPDADERKRDRDLDRETSGERRHTSSRRHEKKERRRKDSRRGKDRSDRRHRRSGDEDYIPPDERVHPPYDRPEQSSRERDHGRECFDRDRRRRDDFPPPPDNRYAPPADNRRRRDELPPPPPRYDPGPYGPPPRRDRWPDGPPPIDDYSPPGRDRGPPPSRRDRDIPPFEEFSPRRDRDVPPFDEFPPKRDRNGPSFDEFPPRRDRNGHSFDEPPPPRRNRDGPSFVGPPSRRGRDGPSFEEPPSRRDRDGRGPARKPDERDRSRDFRRDGGGGRYDPDSPRRRMR